MATPQVLDFSQTGVLDIQDGSGNSLDVIHLRQVNYVGQVNATFGSDMTNPDNTESVFIGIVGRIGGITLDIRNITSPSYADTQALIDAIKNNIAAMYAGGGGGGGVTSVNGDTGPAVVLPLAGFKYNWSTATSGTPANGFVRGNNAAIGSITELVFAIVDDEGNDQLGVMLSIAGGNNWPVSSIGYGGIMVGGLYFAITGAPTVGAEMTVPVAYQDSSGSLPANNAPVAVVVVSQDRVATLVRTDVDGSDRNLAQFIVTGLTDSSGRLTADLSAYSVTAIVAVFGTLANQNAMVLGDILSATACRVAFNDNTNTAIQNEQASMLIYARF